MDEIVLHLNLCPAQRRRVDGTADGSSASPALPSLCSKKIKMQKEKEKEERKKFGRRSSGH